MRGLRGRPQGSPDRRVSTEERENLLQINLDMESPHLKKRRRADFIRGNSCRRKLREARLRWTLLSSFYRIALAFLFLVLFVHLFCVVLDLLFHRYKGEVVASDEKSFAVAINTFRRPKRLKEAVKHYADTCGKRTGVNQVFIIWADQASTPPETFFDRELRGESQDNRASVRVVQVAKDSLNSRFLPISDLTSSAVFMVDDDVRADCFSLSQAFLAWRSHPDSMVGYYPRLAVPPWGHSQKSTQDDFSVSPELVYKTWPVVFWRQKMNFILTKACFLHKRFMELYSSNQHPQEIRNYVDKYFNCEDVAMSVLVANITRAESRTGKPAMPIYVEGSISDQGLFGGISTGGGLSTGSGHFNQRSQCLTELTRIYQEHGWSAPLAHEFDLKDASWVLHSPGFWWQFRPSNFFEWFALGNVLK